MSDIDVRAEQLRGLFDVTHDGKPIVIHGSIGHAVMLGETIPEPVKVDGSLRDIDVFATGVGKYVLEATVTDEGHDAPNPVDAGLSMLIEQEGNTFYISKNGVRVPCDDAEIFDDTVVMHPRELGGIPVRTFSPVAMLAAHSLEPRRQPLRSTHRESDIRLLQWFDYERVTLPPRLASSIRDFQEEYAKTYPNQATWRALSEIYVRVLPEPIRKIFRAKAHKVMNNRAGRPSPHIEQ